MADNQANHDQSQAEEILANLSKFEYAKRPLDDTVWTNWIHFVACGFGIGTIRIAPGTFGTLAAIPFYLIFAKLSLLVYILITIVFVVGGMWLTGTVSRDMKMHDHPGMVWDEIGGFLVVMIGIPATPFYIILGFILFRLFDIWKPGPIKWMDKNLHGGFGIMIDDVAAAACSWVILFIIFQLRL